MERGSRHQPRRLTPARRALLDPSVDEWSVASFYDENRHGPGLEGWWPYLNRRTRAAIPGPPGQGESAAGWGPDPNPFLAGLYPVASYPDSQSPWGLLDTSGTYEELLEDVYGLDFPPGEPIQYERLFAGTRFGPYALPEFVDLYEQPGRFGADSSNYSFLSFRIATTVVPAPGPAIVWAIAFGARLPRRRR